MSTKIDICNLAISKVRGQRILTLNDDILEARICKEFYPILKKKLLRSHPWIFAKVRAALARLTETPAFGYAFYYQIPVTALRVIHSDIPVGIEWEVESGGKVATNCNSVNVVYIDDVDESKFDSNFVELLATMLSIQLAYPVTQNATLKSSLQKEYDDDLRSARTFNAQERGSVKQVQANEWIDVRF